MDGGVMNKSEVSLDMRVYVSGYGKGTVTDLLPSSKFYVRVKYDLDQKKAPGQEINAEVEKMKPLPPPKPTRIEKYYAQVGVIRRTPESYYIAGRIAAGKANIHVSTPPAQLSATQDELNGHNVDFEVGPGQVVTVSTDQTQGRSYTVVMPNHGLVYEYEKLTEVRSTFYQGDESTVSIQAKQFILDFLLDELRFKLGKTQDINLIRSRVPAEFLPQFESGVTSISN
jgi:hypothetical protein